MSGNSEEIMRTARTAMYAFVVAAVAGGAAAHAQAPGPDNQASPWVELSNARVRMLAGPVMATLPLTSAAQIRTT